MKVSVAGNVITVVTAITEAQANASAVSLTATDKKGNQLYRFVKGTASNISNTGMVCNAVIDGKLAAVIAAPIVEGAKYLDDFKKQYGAALVVAAKYDAIVANVATDTLATIDEVFSGAEVQVAVEDETEEDAE